MHQTAERTMTVLMPSDSSPEAFDNFETEVCEVLLLRPGSLCLDCTNLERVDSSHIKSLWNAQMLCREGDVPCQLTNPTAALVRTLHTLDLAEAFTFLNGTTRVDRRLDQDLDLTGLPTSYQETVAADVNAVNAAVDRLICFLRSVGASETTITELRTVFYELATNIRLHSGLSASDTFDVEINADWNSCKLLFTDHGREFHPTLDPQPLDPAAAAMQQRKRGFGIAMIHKMTDRFEYSRRDGKNICAVTKEWRR